MTPQPPSVRDRAAGPAEERLQLLMDACHGIQNDRLRAFIDQGGIGKVMEKMAQPVGPLVPASRDERLTIAVCELLNIVNGDLSLRIPKPVFDAIVKLDHALSPPPSTPEERSVENGI